MIFVLFFFFIAMCMGSLIGNLIAGWITKRKAAKVNQSVATKKGEKQVDCTGTVIISRSRHIVRITGPFMPLDMNTGQARKLGEELIGAANLLDADLKPGKEKSK